MHAGCIRHGQRICLPPASGGFVNNPQAAAVSQIPIAEAHPPVAEQGNRAIGRIRLHGKLKRTVPVHHRQPLLGPDDQIPLRVRQDFTYASQSQRLLQFFLVLLKPEEFPSFRVQLAQNSQVLPAGEFSVRVEAVDAGHLP